MHKTIEIIQSDKGYPLRLNGITLSKKQGVSLGLFLLNAAQSKPTEQSSSLVKFVSFDSSSKCGKPVASPDRSTRANSTPQIGSLCQDQHMLLQKHDMVDQTD